MITESPTPIVQPAPAFRVSTLWKRKAFIVRSGVYFAILAFAMLIVTSWKTQYQAMVRIEPELSTTGEVTSIEAEMDVIQSWATTLKAAQQMGRAVIVTPNLSETELHLSYYIDYVKGLFSGNPVVDFSAYQPSIHLDYFHLSNPAPAIINSRFLLKVTKEGYTLYDQAGQKLLDGKIDAIETATLAEGGDSGTLQLQVSSVNAWPGDSFVIKPLTIDAFTKGLQMALKVERKGFRERSGLMEVTFGNVDPVMAQQFVDTLVNVYIAQAYDRSSLGKIQGLAKLEEQSQLLQQQVADAQKARADFKDSNQIADLSKEQEAAYKRSLEIQGELRKTTTRYKELSATLTDQHPSMIALGKQISFLQDKLKELREELETVPQKERQLEALEEHVNIAQAMLDENTKLAAQLHAEVETITGYAHLVSLHLYEPFSPIARAVIAIILGFMIGALLALSWLIRTTTPYFLRIRYVEDLAMVAPLPVVARLPFKWSGTRWLWYRRYDKNSVATAHQWQKKSVQEIERLEHEIQFLLPQTANKILLFTSINGHEGAAFCARQLAIASAKERKTLLIDANIMQPGAHDEFECKAAPGVAEALTGQADAASVVQSTDIPNLFLLAAGKQTPNFRLLSDPQRMQEMLAKLAPAFGRIIIEFPSITPGICHDGVLGVAHALFLVVNRDTLAWELRKTLDACIITHKTAFFILNKK